MSVAWPIETLCAFCRACSVYVSGRRPFGKDVELDYEEMSDQDWEEEPEGESLSVSMTLDTCKQNGRP